MSEEIKRYRLFQPGWVEELQDWVEATGIVASPQGNLVDFWDSQKALAASDERIKELENAIGFAIPRIYKALEGHCLDDLADAWEKLRKVLTVATPAQPAEKKSVQCSLCHGTGIMPGEHKVTGLYEDSHA